MSKDIDIKIEIVPECEKTQVIIRTSERNEKLEDLIKTIENYESQGLSKITAYDGDRAVLVNQKDIIRVYIENRKVIVRTEKDTLESRLSLKQFENILNQETFVRISRFEIVNLSGISSFDMSITGTIKIIFLDGTETWVARRCVHSIQEKLFQLERGGTHHG